MDITTSIVFICGQKETLKSKHKYIVEGLEKWQIEIDKKYIDSSGVFDDDDGYKGYQCLNMPSGIMFTVFEESEIFETDIYNRSIFAVCMTSDKNDYEDVDDYAMNGVGMIEGNFEFVCCSENSKKLSDKLMRWWENSPIKTLEFAQHCKFWINKDVDFLPPFVYSQTQETRDISSNDYELMIIEDFKNIFHKTEMESLYADEDWNSLAIGFMVARGIEPKRAFELSTKIS